MIDLKQKPELGWNLLLALSLATILGAAWYGFVDPIEKGSSLGPRNDLSVVNATTRKAQEQSTAALSEIRAKTWDTELRTLESGTLDRLTLLATKHKLQLTGFRTDRPREVAGMAEAPFVVVVEGAYPDVLAFSQRLEEPASKLVPELLQFSASDTTPGRVTATIGLIAFLYKEVK